jgi:hypothetical protein
MEQLERGDAAVGHQDKGRPRLRQSEVVTTIRQALEELRGG